MLIFFLFFNLCVYGQYTRDNCISDSLKIELLKNYSNLIRTQSFETIKGINRNTMPIFCKWELDIQDKTVIPVKFRLGSQEYVDKIEHQPSKLIRIN